jgi:hypothetical protein
MQGSRLLRRGVWGFMIFNLLIAIAYAIGVDLSHQFATLLVTVASVWFPSGMTLALVFWLGHRSILGIICLASYFPIFDRDNIPSRVGFVVIDISDRKKAEVDMQYAESILRKANLELEKLVNIDGLTQVVNRRCFDERIVLEGMRSVCHFYGIKIFSKELLRSAQ